MSSRRFCHSSRLNRVKIKESIIIDKYLDLARELEKVVEHDSDSDTNFSWNWWNSSQKTGKKTGITQKQEEETRLSGEQHC